MHSEVGAAGGRGAGGRLAMGCSSSKDNDFDVYYEVVDPPAASLDPKELMLLGPT